MSRLNFLAIIYLAIFNFIVFFTEVNSSDSVLKIHVINKSSDTLNFPDIQTSYKSVIANCGMYDIYHIDDSVSFSLPNSAKKYIDQKTRDSKVIDISGRLNYSLLSLVPNDSCQLIFLPNCFDIDYNKINRFHFELDDFKFLLKRIDNTYFEICDIR